jgi:hypothetical protein
VRRSTPEQLTLGFLLAGLFLLAFVSIALVILYERELDQRIADNARNSQCWASAEYRRFTQERQGD